jgi:hypothetical protein
MQSAPAMQFIYISAAPNQGVNLRFRCVTRVSVICLILRDTFLLSARSMLYDFKYKHFTTLCKCFMCFSMQKALEVVARCQKQEFGQCFCLKCAFRASPPSKNWLQAWQPWQTAAKESIIY